MSKMIPACELTMTTKCKIMALKSIYKRPDLRARMTCVNVGTIGHVDHGKSTLQSAIQSVLGLREDPHYLRLELNNGPRDQNELSRKHLDTRIHRRGRRRL